MCLRSEELLAGWPGLISFLFVQFFFFLDKVGRTAYKNSASLRCAHCRFTQSVITSLLPGISVLNGPRGVSLNALDPVHHRHINTEENF